MGVQTRCTHPCRGVFGSFPEGVQVGGCLLRVLLRCSVGVAQQRDPGSARQLLLWAREAGLPQQLPGVGEADAALLAQHPQRLQRQRSRPRQSAGQEELQCT